jgi:hypothetical protein
MIYLLPTKQLGVMKITLNKVRYERVSKSAIEQRITFNQYLARVLSEASRGVSYQVH